MKRILIFALLEVIILIFIPSVYPQCIPSGPEILDNFIDEDCDGWINGSKYSVRSGHPRIFINEDNIDIIRERAATTQKDVYIFLKNFCDTHMGETESKWMRYWDRRILRYALLYRLGEIPGFTYDNQDNDGDDVYSINDYGRKAVEIMMLLVHKYMEDGACNSSTYYCTDENSIAIVYDWVYDLLTEEQKREIVDYYWKRIDAQNFGAGDGDDPTLAVKAMGYRYGGGMPMALFPGLSFYGDGVNDTLAKRYLDEIIFSWLDELKALNHMAGEDGGHGDALGYTAGYLSGEKYAVGHTLFALKTATSLDIMANQSYIMKVPYYLFYGIVPAKGYFGRYGYTNDTFTKFGDIGPHQWKYWYGFSEDAYVQFRIIANKYDEIGDKDAASFVTWLVENKFNTKSINNTFELLVHTKDITPRSPQELGMPLCRAFGWDEKRGSIDKFEGKKAGIGWVFMRSSWDDPNATYAVFKAEPYYYHGHQHSDSLAFYISKGEDLALPSAGMYFYWFEGCPINECDRPGYPHYHYYFKRTISSNSLLIYNPDEVFMRGGYEWGNDGGQRYDMPSTVRYGHSCVQENGMCDLGGLVRFEDTEDYTCVLADATKAYNSIVDGIEYTENENTPKVSKVARHFVYLKSENGDDDFFVIFDQINSTNPNFKKKWLLHTAGKPVFDGDYTILHGNEEGGISESTDSNLITINGKAHRLFSKTLLPVNPEIRRLGGEVTTILTQDITGEAVPDQLMNISVQSTSLFPEKPVVVIGDEAFYCGGKNETHLLNCLRGYDYYKLNNPQPHSIGDKVIQSYRFMVGGIDYPCLYGTPKSHFPDDHDQYGRWRIEVSPSTNQTYDLFLHVLYPADITKSMPETSLITSFDGNMKGSFIQATGTEPNKVVMFSITGGEINWTQYTLNGSDLVKNLT